MSASEGDNNDFESDSEDSDYDSDWAEKTDFTKLLVDMRSM